MIFIAFELEPGALWDSKGSEVNNDPYSVRLMRGNKFSLTLT